MPGALGASKTAFGTASHRSQYLTHLHTQNPMHLKALAYPHKHHHDPFKDAQSPLGPIASRIATESGSGRIAGSGAASATIPDNTEPPRIAIGT